MYYVITDDELMDARFKTEGEAIEAAESWLKDECNDDARAVVVKGIASFQYEAKITRRDI